MVGDTPGSTRSMRPSASRRANSSATELASAIAWICSDAPRYSSGTSVSGCWKRRFNHHASRGLIQRIAEAETPCSSSQTQASSAVLPAPMMT